jgi:hypothetical protein
MTTYYIRAMALTRMEAKDDEEAMALLSAGACEVLEQEFIIVQRVTTPPADDEEVVLHKDYYIHDLL